MNVSGGYWFLIIAAMVYPSLGEIFSSTIKLRRAVVQIKNLKINNYIASYLSTRNRESANWQNTLDALEAVNELLADPDFRVVHPVYAFKFIRLQAGIVGRIDQDLKKNMSLVAEWAKFEEYFKILPTQLDLEGAAVGLVRIQSTYHLNTANVANGTIDKYPSKSLTAAECLQIADIVKDTEMIWINTLQVAVEWLKEAWTKVVKDKDNTTNILNITRVLLGVYVNANCECSIEAKGLNKTILNLEPKSSFVVISSDKCKGREEYVCQKVKHPAINPMIINRMHALCRQEQIKITSEMQRIRTPQHQLKCRYIHNNDARLVLQPVKLEELHTLPPYIAILHNVINEGEIRFIRNVSESELQRGTILMRGGLTVSKKKVSQTTVLSSKYKESELRNLTSRLSAVTRVNIRGFEDLQVANYGTGGYYDLHRDLREEHSFPNFSLATNNRLLTMVMYLTDVQAGGHTCFPEVGLVSKPKRGNVLLFRNLHRNGSAILESMHTSCPVMVGEKLIANQWVSRYHQEFHFPCSTHQFD